MPSTPKIFVLKSREIIYTLILVFLAVLLILCMILMFTGPKNAPASRSQTESSMIQITAEKGDSTFIPGVYTSAVSLGGNSVNVEVTVNKDQITGIHLANLSTAVTASFPLVSPAFEHLTRQILETQSLQNITCSPENRYTSQLLFSAIERAVNLAHCAGKP